MNTPINKRHIHHIWKLIRPVKTLYLLGAFVFFGVVAVFALRTNYTGMVTLRTAVYEADKNNGNVEQSLQKLRSYVGAHMNTNLDSGTGIYPPIHLKYTYDRLVKAEQERVETVNSQVYTEAQKHCEALYPNSFSGGPRVPCIQDYVKQHGTTAKSIPNALYKFNFVSPRWSPDIAGWSIVFGVLFLALAGLRFGLGRLAKHYLR